MRIDFDDSEAIITVSVEGELTADQTETFQDALHGYGTGEGARLAVDLSGVPTIDSTGLSALIALVSRARLSNGRVVLAGLSPFVAGVMGVAHLDRFFDIAENVAQAKSLLASP